MLKVAVVGVGGISRSHIAAWESFDDAELIALCDIRPEQMEKYPTKRHYTSIDEMLEKETIDILDICLPTFLHAETAIKALNQGINVICEKPISLHAEDVAKVYEAAHKNHVNFMIAQCLRFWPEYELLKEIYDSKRYGKLLSGCMTRLNTIPKWSWDGWMQDEKRSGLVPFDVHIHDLDFMVYAFGAPKSYQTHRCKRPEQDYFNVVYEFDDFFITTESSWYAGCMPFAAAFRFQFEKCVIVWEKGQCIIYEDTGKKIDLTAGEQGETGDIDLPKSNAYANEIRYFADCVKAGKFPEKVKEEELRTVVEILNSL